MANDSSQYYQVITNKDSQPLSEKYKRRYSILWQETILTTMRKKYSSPWEKILIIMRIFSHR